jgi:hypothetical protein
MLKKIIKLFHRHNFKLLRNAAIVGDYQGTGIVQQEKCEICGQIKTNLIFSKTKTEVNNEYANVILFEDEEEDNRDKMKNNVLRLVE